MSNKKKRNYSGNPILPGRGICDPHVRIFADKAYLYATHDASPESEEFVMHDWKVFSSEDLCAWDLECTITPEDTYIGRPFDSCWAVDVLDKRGHYYFYFSGGPKEIGVMEGESPTGPWHDPLGKPLIYDGMVPTEARDPGLFRDTDGASYIVFGTWDFYITRLNDDMISLAEEPRHIEIINPEGPYGKGKTDDKPYLHFHGGFYYLSWGCYYGISHKLYGPYECKGSVITEKSVVPDYRYKQHPLTLDRHGSFFSFKGKWYFICNEMGITQNTYYRDSSIACLNYLANGEMEPVKILKEGIAAPE